MDLGLAFEDEDLLCDEKNKIGDRDVPYNVKICSDQWFETAPQNLVNDDNPNDIVDMEQHIQIVKFSADFHYHQKDYPTASKKYKRLFDLMTPRTNSALRHDVQESLARCYMYTGQTEQGLRVAREMVEASSREDEAKQRQALALLSFACEKAQKWGECVDALEKLCELQSQFSQTLHKLGDVYTHLLKEDVIVSPMSTVDNDILLIKQLSSYLRSKHLFQSVMANASEFIKDRNIAMIQQLDIKIDQVPLSNAKKEFASKFIRKEVENQASSIRDNSSSEVKTSDKPPWGRFYEKFCSWNSGCER